jgi:putative ATPase
VYLQERDPAVRFRIHKEAMSTLLRHAQGDARKLLTLLEAAYWTVPRQTIDTMAESPINSHTQQATLTPQHLASILQQTTIHYDANGDQHYDHASALQKSIRGSDVDASLYWLAKMLVAGEDLRFISRRLMICAAEDIGLADPQAFILAQATSVSVEKLGMPEARIPLATLVVYLAKSPKSNAAYRALDAAMACVQEGHSYPVPLHLRDSHYSGASRLGHGQGYIYTHTAPEQAQQFLPDALVGKRFF